METEAAAARIAKLERDNRRFRWGGAAVAILLGAAIAYVGAQKRGQAGMIEAQGVRLVDSSGHVGIVMDAASITLTGVDENGAPMNLQLQPAGMTLQLGDESNPIAILEVNTKEIDLIDYARGRRAVLNPVVIGLQNGLGESGAPPAWIALRESGFEFQDREGRVRASLGRFPADEPPTNGNAAFPAAIVLYDDQGAILWRAPGPEARIEP